MLKITLKALSAGGAVLLNIANPVNLLFVVLLVMAGFAQFNEQIILVGIISTLALLMAALGAAVLAMILVRFNQTLSPRGFNLFLALALLIPVIVWTPTIYDNIHHSQWLYVAGLVAIMLIASLYLVPKLREVYRAKGVMAQG